MKTLVKFIMICTFMCTLAMSSLVNAQNFAMNGAATPTAMLTSSDPNDTICVGAPVSFNAVVQCCSYSFSLNGNIVQTGGSPLYVPLPAFTVGSQLVVLTVDNGTCAATDTIHFTTLALPTPIITTPDTSICAGTLVTFTASTGGVNYNFKVNGTTVQNGASNIFSTSTLTNGQIVTVTVTNAGGCSSTTGVGITMTVYAPPTATLTTPDNSVCLNTPVTFTASGGVNYNFKVNGTTVQNGASPTYTTSTLTNGAVVTVVVTNGNSCSATSTGITMTIFPLPSATSIVGNTVATCVGTPTSIQINGLTGTGPWTFKVWNTIGGLPSTLYYTVPGNSPTPNTTIMVPMPAVGLNNEFLQVTDANTCSNH